MNAFDLTIEQRLQLQIIKNKIDGVPRICLEEWIITQREEVFLLRNFIEANLRNAISGIPSDCKDFIE